MQVRFSQLAYTHCRSRSGAVRMSLKKGKNPRETLQTAAAAKKLIVISRQERQSCMILREPCKPRLASFNMPELVRSRRLELPRVLPHSDLNAARLPIPPRPHAPAWNFRLLASVCELVKRRTTKKVRPPPPGGSSRPVAATFSGTSAFAMRARNLALALMSPLDTRALDRHCRRQSRND